MLEHTDRTRDRDALSPAAPRRQGDASQKDVERAVSEPAASTPRTDAKPLLDKVDDASDCDDPCVARGSNSRYWAIAPPMPAAITPAALELLVSTATANCCSGTSTESMASDAESKRWVARWCA